MKAPIKNYRLGGVDCAIWENEHSGKKFYSFSFSRSYKDKEGNWKTSGNFNLQDIGNLISICQRLQDRAIKERVQKEKTPEQVHADAVFPADDVPFDVAF